MNNDKLAILTDSASNLTDDLLDLYGIEMISFTAKVGKEDFICWQRGRDYDKAAQGYYDAMRSGAMPQTSLINSHAFIDFFTPFLEAGKDVLYIGMSRGLTGTVGAAQQAGRGPASDLPRPSMCGIRFVRRLIRRRHFSDTCRQNAKRGKISKRDYRGNRQHDPSHESAVYGG